MRKTRRILFLFLIYFFIGIQSVFAVSVTIDPVISPISTEPFELTVTVTGAKTGTNYLRADIFKEETTDYFGETFTGSEWYNGEDGTHYFPINLITDTPAIATISARLSSIPANWSQSDHFIARVRRYTASGNYTGSEASASAIQITILIPTQTPTLVPTSTPPILSPSAPPYLPISSSPPPVSNIYITELLPFPDNSNEWIELYNNNEYEVVLNSWFIDDGEDSGSSPKIFSITIPGKSYRVVDLSTPIFNNNGDIVRLLDANVNEKDSFTYTTTSRGQSIGRNDILNHATCIQVPSKGSTNNSCLLSASSATSISDTGEVFGIDDKTAGEIETENTSSLSKPEYQAQTKQEFNNPGKKSLNDQLQEEELIQPQISNVFDISIKTGTTSTFFISLLNISFILCKMVLRPYD